MLNPLHSSTDQHNHMKRTSAINVAATKITDNFHYERKPSCATTKSTLFSVSKDEWNIKDAGKSMKNALYVLHYVNISTSQAEATSNSESKASARQAVSH